MLLLDNNTKQNEMQRTRSPPNYFRREKFLLKLVGLSFTGDERYIYKIYSGLAFVLINCAYPFLQLGDLFKHDFDVVSDMLIHEFAVLVGLAKTVTLMKNRMKFGRLIDRLERAPFTIAPERGGKNEEKLLQRCVFITNTQTSIYWSMIAFSLTTSFSSTLLKRLTSSDHRDWEFAYGPLTVLNVTHSPNFEISWLYQNFSVCFISCHFVTIDVITAAVLCHISFQFRILQNSLALISERSFQEMLKDGGKCRPKLSESLTGGDSSRIPWKYLRKSLKETVDHHLAIIEVASGMEEIFSDLLMLVLLGTLAILSFLVYHASLLEMGDVRMIRHFGEASLACMQLLSVCFWGEQVAHESQKVSGAAYGADFVGGDVRFQRGLALIIRRSQNPVRLSAGKFTTACLSTFAWILRSSYSAFIVLRKSNEKSL